MKPKGWECMMFSTERRLVTTPSGEPIVELRPVDVMLMWLDSQDGKRLFKIEHSGAWDPPEGDDRSGCYYEDEDLPPGALSLYRITEVIGVKKRALARFRRWLRVH